MAAVGQTDLAELVEGMTPVLNPGEFVFTTVSDPSRINRADTVCEFREREGVTLVLEKKKADELGLSYSFVSAWITLQVHSSLEAVGLTAAFSTELAKHGISCNVIAGYFHDHIFVSCDKASAAVEVLQNLSRFAKKECLFP